MKTATRFFSEAGFFVCNFTSKKGHGESSMQIDSSLSYISPAVSLTSANQSSGARNGGILNSGKEDVEVNIILSGEIMEAPDFKEISSEALPDERKMGKFEDKKGLEQATDLQIGPDIRYALTSKNPDFLKRIRWGPLTVGEYREVHYRIRELESKFETSNNVLSGKIIDTDQLFQEDKSNRDQSQFSVTV
jgi:hypothetical protein